MLSDEIRATMLGDPRFAARDRRGRLYFRCPRHDDSTPSAWMSSGSWGCFTCQFTENIVTLAPEVGVQLRGERHHVAAHTYHDQAGTPIYYRDRFVDASGRKTILPRQPNGARNGNPPVPYRLHEVTAALQSGAVVIICEGEKAADALAENGFVATTTGSASSSLGDNAHIFRDARVVLWPDADEPGETYAARIAGELRAVAADVRVLRFTEKRDGWDAFDFFAEGGTVEQLDTLVADAPTWEHDAAESEPRVFATLAELLTRPELLQPPECVLPRIAYRGRTVALCGPDKAGKSTLMAHGEVAVANNSWFLNQHVNARTGRVVHVGLEEALGDAVRRLAELGAEPENIQLVLMSPPDLLLRIRQLLADWPADLLVIDSLTEYARVACGGVPDDGDSAGWSAVVRPLVSLARERDVALVLIHHVRRSDGQYRGSSEIAAAVDALLEITTAPGGEEPNVRKIRGRGRWNIEPFAVALRDDRYELVGGAELSVDARVLLHVERSPGTSKSATRRAVGGRASAVDAAINRLLERGALQQPSAGGLFPASGQLEVEV